MTEKYLKKENFERDFFENSTDSENTFFKQLIMQKKADKRNHSADEKNEITFKRNNFSDYLENKKKEEKLNLNFQEIPNIHKNSCFNSSNQKVSFLNERVVRLLNLMHIDNSNNSKTVIHENLIGLDKIANNKKISEKNLDNILKNAKMI